jgi:glycosyltransferase involved in cell wall biosynthesis
MVIATDVGSVSSVVHNQENGLLIAAGNLEALIQAMLSVVSNRDYLARFESAAQSQVNSNYSYGRMVRRYAELYQELRAA